MKDDSTEISARRRYFRYAVFSLIVLLVMSLGMVLIPPQPPAPAETPFSERARAAALDDALVLRAAGQELAASAAAHGGPGSTAALDHVVTLLTIQARALLLPGDPVPGSAAPGPASAKDFAAKLSASGARRLTDALEADGGMARLLAGAGAAQLLAAEEVAASAGVQEEELPGWQEPATASAQAAPATTACTSTGPLHVGEVTGLDMALTAALDSELETVYGYQAALTRLDAVSAAQASSLLAEHLDLADEAEAYAAKHCAAVPPTQPGYVLDGAFLGAPAEGLARLESGSLAAFGDVAGLSTVPTRTWAVSALVAAARRTLHWGGDPGPVPGLPLDEARLPPLPEVPAAATPTASPAAT